LQQPAFQAQSPEFIPQTHLKKKKKKRQRSGGLQLEINPGQTVHEPLSQKKNLSQKRADRVTQNEGPEFKP
jgi:hypothetical protein